jgi:hypothetical protein
MLYYVGNLPVGWFFFDCFFKVGSKEDITQGWRVLDRSSAKCSGFAEYRALMLQGITPALAIENY